MPPTQFDNTAQSQPSSEMQKKNQFGSVFFKRGLSPVPSPAVPTQEALARRSVVAVPTAEGTTKVLVPLVTLQGVLS